METLTDNRFEIIEQYKQKLIDTTNIAECPEEMAQLDSILFRMWQKGWLENKKDKYKQLEEKIGCPLEVLVTAIMQKGIFTIYGYVDTDNVGYTSDNKFVMNVDRWEYEQQLLLVSDYKVTWWLKADKSE